MSLPLYVKVLENKGDLIFFLTCFEEKENVKSSNFLHRMRHGNTEPVLDVSLKRQNCFNEHFEYPLIHTTECNFSPSYLINAKLIMFNIKNGPHKELIPKALLLKKKRNDAINNLINLSLLSTLPEVSNNIITVITSFLDNYNLYLIGK